MNRDAIITAAENDLLRGEIKGLQMVEDHLTAKVKMLEDKNETLKSVNNELVRILTKVASQAKPIIFVAEDKNDVTKIEEFLNKYAVSFK